MSQVGGFCCDLKLHNLDRDIAVELISEEMQWCEDQNAHCGIRFQVTEWIDGSIQVFSIEPDYLPGDVRAYVEERFARLARVL